MGGLSGLAQQPKTGRGRPVCLRQKTSPARLWARPRAEQAWARDSLRASAGRAGPWGLAHLEKRKGKIAWDPQARKRRGKSYQQDGALIIWCLKPAEMVASLYNTTCSLLPCPPISQKYASKYFRCLNSVCFLIDYIRGNMENITLF